MPRSQMTLFVGTEVVAVAPRNVTAAVREPPILEGRGPALTVRRDVINGCFVKGDVSPAQLSVVCELAGPIGMVIDDQFFFVCEEPLGINVGISS